MKFKFLLNWTLLVFILQFRNSQLSSESKIDITKGFSISSQLNKDPDIVQNGITNERFEGRNLNIAKIAPYEIFHRFSLLYDQNFIQIAEIETKVESQNILSVQSILEENSSKLLVQFVCKYSGSSIVTFRILITDKDIVNEAQIQFSLVKFCGDFPILQMRMGLNQQKQTKQSTAEILLNGKIQEEFLNGDLSAYKETSQMETFYISYYPQYEKYSNMLSLNQEQIKSEKKWYFIQRLIFEKLYFEVEDTQIIEPQLFINEKALNLQIISMKSFTDNNPLQSRHLQRSFLQIDQSDDTPELAEDDGPEKQNANSVKEIDIKSIQSIMMSKKLQSAQNNLLKELKKQLENKLTDLENENESAQTNLEKNTIQNLKNRYKNEIDTLNTQKKGLEDQNTQLEDEVQLMDNKQNSMQNLIQNAFESGGIDQTSIEILNNLQQTMQMQKPFGQLSQLENEMKSKQKHSFTLLQSDVTMQKLNLKKDFPLIIQNECIQLQLEFNCKKKGKSQFILNMLPFNAYMPFDPIRLKFTKECSDEKINKHFLLGMSQDDFNVYSKGVLRKEFSPQNSSFNISSDQDEITFYMKINKTLASEEKINFPQVKSDNEDILIADIQDVNGISMNQLKQQKQNQFSIRKNQIGSFKVKIHCKAFGFSKIEIQINPGIQYTGFKISLGKICANENLNLNLLGEDGVVYMSNDQQNYSVNSRLLYSSSKYTIESKNKDNDLKVKMKITEQNQSPTVGEASIYPKETVLSRNFKQDLLIKYYCRKKGTINLKVLLDIPEYKLISLDFRKECLAADDEFLMIFIIFLSLLILVVIFYLLKLLHHQFGICRNLFREISGSQEQTDDIIGFPNENAHNFIRICKAKRNQSRNRTQKIQEQDKKQQKNEEEQYDSN